MQALVLTHEGATGLEATLRELEAASWEVRAQPWEAVWPGAPDLVLLPDGHLPLEALPAGLDGRLRTHLDQGGFLLGLGLGFRQLCALGLLPGTWCPAPGGFRHQMPRLRVEHGGLPFTRGLGLGEIGDWPEASDQVGPWLEAEERLDLELAGRVAFRRLDGEFGASWPAGLVGWEGRLLGLAALPERVPGALGRLLAGLAFSKC